VAYINREDFAVLPDGTLYPALMSIAAPSKKLSITSANSKFSKVKSSATCGDADRTVPIAASGLRTAELIKCARLVIVPDWPHGIPWTHAEQVNAELVNFLGQKLGARGEGA
jgi:pimeloyl-ACP methyl ester carboxylesterase